MAITGARHAFLGRVEQDRQRLVLEEYSRGVHGDCRTRQDSAHFPLADAGLWAEAIRRQESFIENNYADGGALHKGLPQGHLAIRNFMASPIVREGEVVSLVCLANKPGGFDEDDELMVDSFATGYWLLLERQQMERDLEEKAQQLERSNIELQQFAYVASHDLQEPLRMVSSYVQLLNRRYGDKLDQDAKEFIGFAVDGAERMRMLIQDLLAFSRVTTKGRPLEPTDSGRVLDLALNNLQVIIAETGTKVEKGEMPQIPADQGQLVQVFQNLVQNAIKFRGPQPPVVRIGSEEAGRRMALLGERQRGGHRRAVLRSHLHHLSTPAQQNRVRRHRHRAGPGQKNRGAPRRAHLGGIHPRQRFHFLLYHPPRVREAFMQNLSIEKQINILLVEDNPGDARLAQEALKENKVANTLHWVDDGVKALEFLHQEGPYADAPRPDVILLDLNLPRKDGREVLADIKEDPELKRIPVVVLTVSQAEEDILKNLQPPRQLLHHQAPGPGTLFGGGATGGKFLADHRQAAQRTIVPPR